MIARQKKYGPASIVRVKSCWGGYRLPAGLPEEAVVRVLSMNEGTVDVEFKQRKFRVSPPCIESGWEYEYRGRWYDENTPFIIWLLKWDRTKDNR